MDLLRIIAILFTAFICIAADAQTPESQQSSIAIDESAHENLLAEGAALLRARKPEEAMSTYIDPVIAAYEEKYRNAPGIIYCARSQVEVLFYLLQAAAEKKSATTLKSTWGDALYLKAYALFEVRRLADAKEMLRRAIKLSPKNASYHAELGQIHSYEKNWSKAIESYHLATSAAEEFSPPKKRTAELTRAWRGMAYVKVELGRLDEAEALYEKCLALNPDDRSAAAELRYVRSLRTKQGLQRAQ